MPFRSFKCVDCGRIDEHLTDLHDDGCPDCPDCDGQTTRNYRAEGHRKHSTGAFGKPITMYSVAMDPTEVGDFKRAFPDTDLDMGVPIARNRPEKMRILKHFGYQENN